MNNEKLFNLEYCTELSNLALQVYNSLIKGTELNYYVFEGDEYYSSYIHKDIKRPLIKIVNTYWLSSAMNAIRGRNDYAYISKYECIYSDNIYKHSNYNINEDFFALSLVHNNDTMKYLHISSSLCKYLDNEMILINLELLEKIYCLGGINDVQY